MGILECPSEEVVFVSTGYTSIYQMVRCVYTKANVWCKPQGKQQRLGKEKSPTSVFPCTVSSELLPVNSSGEHGIQVTTPGDGGWTADRTLLPLWWEAQWCCRCRMDGQMDGIRAEEEYRHWEGERWHQYSLSPSVCRQVVFDPENWERGLSRLTLICKEWETRVLSLDSAPRLKHPYQANYTSKWPSNQAFHHKLIYFADKEAELSYPSFLPSFWH